MTNYKFSRRDSLMLIEEYEKYSEFGNMYNARIFELLYPGFAEYKIEDGKINLIRHLNIPQYNK